MIEGEAELLYNQKRQQINTGECVLLRPDSPHHLSTLTKLFKEEMGRTPKHYLISERMKRAKQMLLGELTLGDIAQQLNYTSIHYFSYQFKKETGLSPSEFRQQGSSQLKEFK